MNVPVLALLVLIFIQLIKSHSKISIAIKSLSINCSVIAWLPTQYHGAGTQHYRALQVTCQWKQGIAKGLL